MVDMHYDLLTIAYICYLKNDYSELKKINEEIKTSNVKYIFANLCFLDEEAMKCELNALYYRKDISVIEMFKKSIEILNGTIKCTNFIYCIEGCDYVEIDDLEELYKLGLRSIILTWNNKNRYGSGIYAKRGLTKFGKQFLKKAISLNIAIDLSHANKRTFNSMIRVLKKEKNSVYFVSHSNMKKLENRKRNLSNSQLKQLKKIKCKVGIFSNKNFIDKNGVDLKISYLNHIVYAIKHLGIDSVMVSTDDMRFCSDNNPIYNDLIIFNYNNLYNEMYELLKKRYSDSQIKKILFNNANEIIEKIK